jgi:hypothetical protein
MTFVIVGEAECETGKFMDALAPDVRAKAGAVEAAAPQPDPWSETADVIGHLVAALRYVHEVGRLTHHEHQVVAEALARFDAWKWKVLR